MSGKFRNSWIAWRENLNTKLNKYNPVPKTEDMTVPVGIDDEGKLWCENDPDKDIPYIKFSSPKPFTLKTSTGGKIWTPITALVEYSYDKETWTNWGGSLINSGPKNVLYLRGSNATTFGMGTSTSSTHRRLVLDGENIKLSGDIEGILSHGSRIDGEFPNVSNGTFKYLFEDNLALTNIYDLRFERETLPTSYMASMFRNDKNLTIPPRVIKAKECGERSLEYAFCNSGVTTTPLFEVERIGLHGMEGTFRDCFELLTAKPFGRIRYGNYAMSAIFYGCSKLKRAPEIGFPLTVGGYIFEYMFQKCSSLETLYTFEWKNIGAGSFRYMYAECPLIKIYSSAPTGVESSEYMIPMQGGGTPGTDAFKNMFTGTGGSFTGTPSGNTLYYTTNELIVMGE